MDSKRSYYLAACAAPAVLYLLSATDAHVADTEDQSAPLDLYDEFQPVKQVFRHVRESVLGVDRVCSKKSLDKKEIESAY
jgi:hypothetical protein